MKEPFYHQLSRKLGLFLMVFGAIGFLISVGGYIDATSRECVYAETSKIETIPGLNKVELVGTVYNNCSIPLSSVSIRGILFDQDGLQINSKAGEMESDKVIPGGSSSFQLLVDDPDHKMTQVMIQVAKVTFIYLPWEWLP